MKYFIDTEFIEGFHKPLFGKRRHFIDLISIGIYCEDGREYYAISSEFNSKDADKWVKENVIDKLEQQATSFYDSPRLRGNCLLYKSNKKIAEEICRFVCSYENASEYAGVESIDKGFEYYLKANPPEFYGYYSDYDWVVFCSLFGRMIDLPKGFPMYCKDLKQMLDDKVNKYNFTEDIQKNDEILKSIKGNPNYPKQENEHNALADAKWNYNLYQFLNTI